MKYLMLFLLGMNYAVADGSVRSFRAVAVEIESSTVSQTGSSEKTELSTKFELVNRGILKIRSTGDTSVGVISTGVKIGLREGNLRQLALATQSPIRLYDGSGRLVWQSRCFNQAQCHIDLFSIELFQPTLWGSLFSLSQGAASSGITVVESIDQVLMFEADVSGITYRHYIDFRSPRAQ